MNPFDICFDARVMYTQEFVDNVYRNERKNPEDERPLYNLYKDRQGRLSGLTNTPGIVYVQWDDSANLTKVHIDNIRAVPTEEDGE